MKRLFLTSIFALNGVFLLFLAANSFIVAISCVCLLCAAGSACMSCYFYFRKTEL